MTREEAIKQLKDNRVLCINSETEPFAIAYDMAIKALEQDAIHIPDGATNGDMIKAIFPNVECREDRLGNVFIISSVQLGTIAFRESWWNASYKGGCNLSEKPAGSESEDKA